MAESEKSHVSRREMMKMTASLAALTGAAMVPGTVQAKECEPVTNRFEELFDIVVVGSGFAGMSAAVQAREKGNSVLIVEKMPVFGGNSTINGGAMSVANSHMQAKEGVNDSVELMVNDMLKAGRDLNDVDLLKMVCNGTSDAIKWLEQYGVEFKQKLFHWGGHQVPRTLLLKEGSGSGIIRKLVKAAQQTGIDMYRDTRFDSFIKNEAGRIVGITATTGCTFPKTNGKEVTYGARKGVIVAAGGFSADVNFRTIQRPKFEADLGSTNHPGATAETLKQLITIGGTPVHLDQIQLAAWCSADEKSNVVASKFYETIVLDPRKGSRFYDESADRKTRTDAILNNRDAGGKPVYPIALTNKRLLLDSMSKESIQKGINAGVIKKSDTLEELANHYAMPLSGLKNQMENWSKFSTHGNDEQFGRSLKKSHDLSDGPWYSLRVWPKVHYCMGGIRVNTKSQVLDLISDAPIEGLYAAGEATGGIHGASRLGGCSISECVVTGRNAAEKINMEPAAPLKKA
jgi:flavocytochrome c